MKRGIFTTEFWLVILTNIITIVGALKGVIPGEWAAGILGIANTVYGILRSFVKASPNTPNE